MELIQNVPFFSIMLSMFSGIVSAILPEKWAKWLNTAMIIVVGTLSGCLLFDIGHQQMAGQVIQHANTQQQ